MIKNVYVNIQREIRKKKNGTITYQNAIRALSLSGEIMGEYFEIFYYLDFDNSLDFINM